MLDKYNDMLTVIEKQGLELMMASQFNREVLNRLLIGLDNGLGVVAKEVFADVQRKPHLLNNSKLAQKEEADNFILYLTWD